MTVDANYLERKINSLNNWLQHHPETHHAYSQKRQNRDYYVGKLCDMDELNIATIKI